jgi:putative Ca2+/H+ antiporter (TMEM165/GDT1 family)
MESSNPSANSSDPHPHNRWAEFMGAVIALLTLTLPVFVIGYYSSNRVDILQQTTYSLPRPDK